MSFLDGISGLTSSAYNAASHAAAAAASAAQSAAIQAAGAVGAAAQSVANSAQDYARSHASNAQPAHNPSSSAASIDEPARTRSSQVPPHLRNAHEAELDSDSDDDEKGSVNSNGQNAAQQQSKGWTPYQPLPKNASLGVAFEALKNDALYTAQKKMETELKKLKEIEAKVNLLGDILDKVNALSEAQEATAATGDKGGFDCTTEGTELLQLMKNARNLGLIDSEIPEKTKFTKREKDLLIKQIERKTREQERMIKEQTSKIEESKTMLNEFISILKACADKIHEAIKKILQNIKQ